MKARRTAVIFYESAAQLEVAGICIPYPQTANHWAHLRLSRAGFYAKSFSQPNPRVKKHSLGSKICRHSFVADERDE